jgi:hypothetical protein
MRMAGAPKIIAQHYSTITKGAKIIGRIGMAGDIVASIGAVNNLLNEPTNIEYLADAVFTGIGWFPVVGDGIALSYMGTKDYIKNPQNYTNIPKPGDRSYISPVRMISDSTFKRNIQPIDSSLSNILKLHGYRYNWIESPLTPNDSIDIGVLAQEVELLYPELVTIDSTGVKRVYYYKFIPILIEAIKEQQITISEQDVLLQKYYRQMVENANILKEMRGKLDEFTKSQTNNW